MIKEQKEKACFEIDSIDSIQSTYKNTLNIRTAPVVKQDGQWKIVIGIPPSGVKSLNLTRSEKEKEVAKLFEDYSKAIKSHDDSKMKTYIKTATKTSDNKIEQHLKAMAQGPTPDISTYGIKMITDSLAIAQIETKYPNHSYAQNLAVYNENGQWKIIFGQPMTNSFIPLSDKSVDVK